MAISIPLINGERHAFASVELRIEGKRYTCNSWNHTEKNEFGEVVGNSTEVLGYTPGDHRHEVDFEMYLEDFTDFIRSLGNGYMKKMFSADVSYQLDGNSYVINEFYSGIKMTEISASQSQSNEGLKRKVSGKCLQMRRDDRFGIDVSINLTF